MAVSTTNAYDGPFSANGVTQSFPFTFTAQTAGDVAVLLNDQPIIGGYSVELYEGGGGTVTFPVAPGPGSLVVWLDPDFTQTTAFENGSAWLAAPVNLANDRAALRDQALSRDLNRCMRMPLGESAGTLPSASRRRGKFLSFSSIDGTPSLADAVTTDAQLRADVASVDANKGATLVGTSGGGTLQQHLDRTTLPSVAALLASPLPARGAGTMWRAGPYAYLEAAPLAADQHLTTAGGVKLYAVPEGRTVWAEQFGAVGDGVTNCLAQIQRAVNTGYNVMLGAGAFNIGAGAIVPVLANQSISGANAGTRILYSGTRAISIRPAQGMTGAAMFTTFATNLRVARIYFQYTGTSIGNASAYAVRAINVRGLTVEDCEFQDCGLLFVAMEAEENKTYDRTTGSTTVDPAVLAGFSATDINDLNEHIYVRRNRSWNTVYGSGGVRINWARYGEISDNVLGYSNISWWGGAAGFAQGGAVQFLRRFAHFRITGNYCSWNNGGIYGNNGESVIVANNTLEYATDTALDFEGCSNCLAIGNTIRHFGNFACSVFYAALNIAFRANTIECTLEGASTAARAGATTYMQSAPITGYADAGNGTTKVTVSGDLDIQTGQQVLITEITPTPLAVTRVSANEFIVPLAWNAALAGGYLRYQQGRTYFQAIAGNSTTLASSVQEVVEFSGNAVTARDGLIGRTGDGPTDLVVVSGNMLTNCVIHLTYGLGGTKIVENNRLMFKSATVPPRGNYALIDMQGHRTRGSVSDNQIVLASALAWVPAGSAAINATVSAYTPAAILTSIERNRILVGSGASVALGINHSSENTHPAYDAVARITGNVVPSAADVSPAGTCATLWRDNIAPTGLSLDRQTLVPANGSTVTLGAMVPATYLNHTAALASLTLALPVDPADEAVFRVTSRAGVTALTITNATTGTPTVYGTAPTALAAGQTVQVRFAKALNAWIWE